MKLKVERDVLAEAVAWTARSLPPRPPVPVLAGVRLDADSSGALTLSTFDYDVSARSTVAAEVEETTVLPAGDAPEAVDYADDDVASDEDAWNLTGR